MPNIDLIEHLLKFQETKPHGPSLGPKLVARISLSKKSHVAHGAISKKVVKKEGRTSSLKINQSKGSYIYNNTYIMVQPLGGARFVVLE